MRGKADSETTSNIVTVIAILKSLMNGAFRAPSLRKRNIHKQNRICLLGNYEETKRRSLDVPGNIDRRY